MQTKASARGDLSTWPFHWGRGLCVFAAASASLALLILCAGFGSAQFDDPEVGVARSLSLKRQAALASAPGPKLVVAGGSSALFGVDSGRLELATGMRTFNAGLPAGLGPRYHFFLLRRFLAPGDIVLLSLEFDSFVDDYPAVNRFSARTSYSLGEAFVLDIPVRHIPLYLREIPLGEVAGNLVGLEQYRRIKASDATQGRLDHRGDVLFVDDPLARRKFQEDARAVCGHVAARVEAGCLAGLERRETLRALADFATWCADRGIRLLAAYPCHAPCADHEEPAFRELYAAVARVYSGLGIPLVNTPRDSRLEPHQMFDSFYHANPEGRSLHTGRIVPGLRNIPAPL